MFCGLDPSYIEGGLDSEKVTYILLFKLRPSPPVAPDADEVWPAVKKVLEGLEAHLLDDWAIVVVDVTAVFAMI